MFSNEEIAAVRDSWSAVSKRSDAFTERFYALLFTNAPHLEKHFQEGVARQRFQLFAMLSTLVGAMDVVDQVEGSIRRLGEGHRRFDLSAEDYAAFNSTLTRALAETLNEQWTDAAAQAWRALLDAITGMMVTTRSELAAAG